MTAMIVLGMGGSILSPLLGGTALSHLRWEWLLVNAPIALIAGVGVRLGVPGDRPEDVTSSISRGPSSASPRSASPATP